MNMYVIIPCSCVLVVGVRLYFCWKLQHFVQLQWSEWQQPLPALQLSGWETQEE